MEKTNNVVVAIITVMGSGIFTILGIFLNRKTTRSDGSLVEELRSELRDKEAIIESLKK